MVDNIEFLTPSRLNDLWGTIKTLLSFASPSVMIWAAIAGVGLLIYIVASSFKKAEKGKPDADHSEDYEVRRY